MTKSMENRRKELIARGQTLAEVKIQIGFFQGNYFLPQSFSIAMIPLDHVLRKYAWGYKFSKPQENICHF